MKRDEIILRLRELALPEEEYWLVAGGAMVLYGIRGETGDIDLGCSRTLADRLEADGYPVQRLSDGRRWFVIEHDIEVFEEWLFDGVDTVEGIPVISLKGLVSMKKQLGREKDLADMAAIEAFLRRQSKN